MTLVGKRVERSTCVHWHCSYCWATAFPKACYFRSPAPGASQGPRFLRGAPMLGPQSWKSSTHLVAWGEELSQNLSETPGQRQLCPTVPRCHYQSGAEQSGERIAFPTVRSGNLRNCSFIKHIGDSALFAYWYPWRKGIQRWGCECYLLDHHFRAARTVLFAL